MSDRRPGERIGPLAERVAPPPRSTPDPDYHDRDSRLFGRLSTLSDGVFAISLTLLVFSFDAPATLSIDDFGRIVADLAPTVVAFTVTVFVVGVYWREHHHLLELVRGVDGPFVAANVGYLALIALVPFPNTLLGNHQGEPLAYVSFAVVLAALTAVDTGMIVYANRAGLLRRTVTAPAVRLDVTRGLVVIAVFLASVPLSFWLVEWTPLLWIGSLALDELLSTSRRE